MDDKVDFGKISAISHKRLPEGRTPNARRAAGSITKLQNEVGLMNDGRLIVAKRRNRQDRYVIMQVHDKYGFVLDSSEDLTEDELKTALSWQYKETTAQIESRIALAGAHPAI
jgi:hypothetical protein